MIRGSSLIAILATLLSGFSLGAGCSDHDQARLSASQAADVAPSSTDIATSVHTARDTAPPPIDHAIPERGAKTDSDGLMNQDEPNALLDIALAFAVSESDTDLEMLSRELHRSEFHDRLDPPATRAPTYTYLRLHRVVQTIAQNPQALSRLLALLNSEAFRADLLRAQILIAALAALHPAPPEAIAYWIRFSEPGSPLAYDVVDALVENQSPPALELFRATLGNPDHELATKSAWIRNILLPRRNDVPLLIECEQLIGSVDDVEFRIALVEVIFDYQPDQWYRAVRPPEPPPQHEASPEAKKIFERIGNAALNQQFLSRELKHVIRERLIELRR